jgi:hypothetical protein
MVDRARLVSRAAGPGDLAPAQKTVHQLNDRRVKLA